MEEVSDKFKYRFNAALTGILLLFLAACGGGSSDSGGLASDSLGPSTPDPNCTKQCTNTRVCTLGEGCINYLECFGCSVPENKKPIAVLKSLQRATLGVSAVALDATNSSDPENQTLTYHWSFVSQPPGSIISLDQKSSSQPSFLPDKTGQYVVALSVADYATFSDVVHQVIFVDSPLFANNPAIPDKYPFFGIVETVIFIDANSDGLNDVVLGNCDDELIVLLRDGAIWSKSQTLISGRPSADDGVCHKINAVGDFNSDGFSDFAVDNEIYTGDGNGLFTLMRTLENGSIILGLTAGDFNGDGIDDLAVARDKSDEIRIHFGGNPTRLSNPISNPLNRQAVALDLNGDNISDMIFFKKRYGSDGQSEASIVLGNISENYSESTLTMPGYGQIEGGDMNGDGKTDLVVNLLGGYSGSGAVNESDVSFDVDVSIATYIGNGNGTFLPPMFTGVAVAGGSGMAIGEINGDDKPDVLVAGTGPAVLSVLLGDGFGGFESLGIFENYPRSLSEFGDVDADGLTDIFYTARDATYFISGSALIVP